MVTTIRAPRRGFLLSENLAKAVGFKRLNLLGRNRVTLRGSNPIYMLAAQKCGLTVKEVHAEVSQRIAPTASANCFWIWWCARRAMAKENRKLRKIERLHRRRERGKRWPSRKRDDEKRAEARERYQKNIVMERARARTKMALRRSIRRFTATLDAQTVRRPFLTLKGVR